MVVARPNVVYRMVLGQNENVRYALRPVPAGDLAAVVRDGERQAEIVRVSRGGAGVAFHADADNVKSLRRVFLVHRFDKGRGLPAVRTGFREEYQQHGLTGVGSQVDIADTWRC